MAARRKVTPEVQDRIVTEWMKWHLGHYPDTTLENHLSGQVPVSVVQMYKYIPEHLKRASKVELQRYLDEGWEIPLALREQAPAADAAAAQHFLELWAAADADAKAAHLQLERVRATIQAVLDMDPSLSRSTKAALRAQLQ